MKKIPTLFIRTFENHKIKSISNEIQEGLEWVLSGEGTATEKIDGACCAIIDGVFYKRYDAKRGKKAPDGAIPCCPPDPITGHHPHWLKVDPSNPSDKWFLGAYYNAGGKSLPDATYEAIGPHFQGNPYGLEHDTLEAHGLRILEDVPRSFEGIRDYLRDNAIEGIVFWKDGQPQCKIKRTDFCFPWNTPNHG